MDILRRSRRVALLLLVASLVLLVPRVAAADASSVPGEVLVRYRPGVAPAARAAVRAAIPGLRRVRAFDFVRVEHLVFEGIATEQAIARLAARPEVEYAEPNYLVYADVVPNDPSFGQLWGLQNTGQGGAYAGDDIDAPLAWDQYTGSATLKIGVIDTGIDYTHPDLAANVWTNPGEVPGNGKDDDHNGYVDDVHGYDVLNLDGDPMDDSGHGTHVAGTIGAVGNNAVGVTGVNWHCALVAIKFMNATGVGTEADAIAAIQYSLVVGVKLTNNSWGNMPGGQALHDAIDAAGAAGQLMIFAAGNNGWNLDFVPVYPPTWRAPNMVVTAATDGRDLRPTWSNYGAATVDLGAPGAAIYSCKPGATYQSLNGTSMACPHVTGSAALVMGRYPQLSIAQVRQLILSSVEPIASMNGTTITGGRLNAYHMLLNADVVPPGRITDVAFADTGSTSVGLRWTATGDDGTSGRASVYDLRMSTAPLDSITFATATLVPCGTPAAAGAAEALQVTTLHPASDYWFAIRAVDELGNTGPISNVAHVVTQGPPTIAVSPAAIDSPLVAGAIVDVPLHIANVGQGRLDVSASATSGSWLGVSPAACHVVAGGSVDLLVRLDATGLADGRYAGSVSLASNDSTTGTVTVPVALGVIGPADVDGAAPRRDALRVTSPVPGGEVELRLALSETGEADVSVFDVRGRRVGCLVSCRLAAGEHALRWTSDAAGVFFVRARTAGGTLVRRVVLLR